MPRISQQKSATASPVGMEASNRVRAERDVEDDAEHGVDGLVVRASKGPMLSGMPLKRLVERLRMFQRALSKIDRRADGRIVATVLHASGLGKIELRERKHVEAAVPAIRARLEKKCPDMFPLSIDVGWEIDSGAATIAIRPRPGSRARPVTIDWSLVESPEYAELYGIESDIRSIGPAPYFVRERQEDVSRETEVEDSDALLAYIDNRGRKLREGETLGEKMLRARAIGAQLSDATDLLNRTLTNAEQAFVGLRLGVRASIDITDEEDKSANNSSELAFEKNDGQWGIVLVSGAPDENSEGRRTHILKTSKECRVRAADALPKLLDALIVKAEEQRDNILRRADEVNALVEGMKS